MSETMIDYDPERLSDPEYLAGIVLGGNIEPVCAIYTAEAYLPNSDVPEVPCGCLLGILAARRVGIHQADSIYVADLVVELSNCAGIDPEIGRALDLGWESVPTRDPKWASKQAARAGVLAERLHPYWKAAERAREIVEERLDRSVPFASDIEEGDVTPAVWKPAAVAGE